MRRIKEALLFQNGMIAAFDNGRPLKNKSKPIVMSKKTELEIRDLWSVEAVVIYIFIIAALSGCAL